MSNLLTKLKIESYNSQINRWPITGNHILAQFDAHTIVVYQAFKPAIGLFAANNGYFGDQFSFTRMSWIKTNFLWMMYRSGWGTKERQEIVLAVRLKRTAFDTILEESVNSIFQKGTYSNQPERESAITKPSVRFQWDPDYSPIGARLERRALQIGLRNSILAKYTKEWIVEIENISLYVQNQHQYGTPPYNNLFTPREDVYPVVNKEIGTKLGIS